MNADWSSLHENYKTKDWINRPSLFAETAALYFPANARILELGAGLGQDSRYFAALGHTVTSTDLEQSALDHAATKITAKLRKLINFRVVDLRDELPFEADSYDVVYAHLSLHYFDYETTVRLFGEIQRLLKTGGIVAFLTNSTDDPEYGTGSIIETDYYQLEKAPKRFFNVETTRSYTQNFDTTLLDNRGETYNDNDKGVHNLIRYIGLKRAEQPPTFAIPYCGAIIERERNGEIELLLQTRWKPYADAVYSGTLEFPAGTLDHGFENIYDTLARAIKEECGLILRTVRNRDSTEVLNTGKDDAAFGFRPFCSTQQLKNGRPWIGFIFICTVEDGEPQAQLSKAKDAQWMKRSEVKERFESQPDQFFGLELPAWQYYFSSGE